MHVLVDVTPVNKKINVTPGKKSLCSTCLGEHSLEIVFEEDCGY